MSNNFPTSKHHKPADACNAYSRTLYMTFLFKSISIQILVKCLCVPKQLY